MPTVHLPPSSSGAVRSIEGSEPGGGHDAPVHVGAPEELAAVQTQAALISDECGDAVFGDSVFNVALGGGRAWQGASAEWPRVSKPF